MHWYFPLFTLAFLSAVGVSVSFDPLARFQWFVPVLIVGFGISYLIARRLKKEQFALCLLVGCCIGFGYTNIHAGFVREPLLRLNGKKIAVSATITNYADRYEESQRVACKVAVTGRPGVSAVHTLVYLPLTAETLAPGDRIAGTFRFYRPKNIGGFDRMHYYAGQNYHIMASLEDEDSLSIEKAEQIPLHLRPVVWAETLKAKLTAGLTPRSAGLLKGLLLGDTAELTLSDRQNMQKAGLSHITSVSGMHIGFLVGFFVFIFGRRVGLLLSLGVLVVFVPVAGASPSVIRAAVMYAFAAVGFYMRLEHSALHSLCAALVILLVHNPYAFFSLGLQLSFLSTLGLILFAKPLQNATLEPFKTRLKKRWKQKAANAVVSAAACSLCALVFTMPVLLSAFGYVSAASVVANVLTISIFSIIFIAGILLFIPVIGGVLAVGIELLSSYVLGVASVVGSWTFTLLYWDAWYTKVLVVGIYLVVAGAFLFKRWVRFWQSAAAVCVMTFAALTLNWDVLQQTHRTTLLTNGAGQSIAVSYGQELFALVDCGASGYLDAAKNVAAYMDWHGYAQIDLLILSGLGKLQTSGISTLLHTIPVQYILIPPETRDNESGAEVFKLADELHIPLLVWSAEGERPAGDTRLGLSVIGGVPRKLGVRIAPQSTADLLTLHSLTPKMMHELLEMQPFTCDTLVLSDQFLTGEDTQDTLASLHPAQIYMPSAGETPSKLHGIPVRSTYAEGDITHGR